MRALALGVLALLAGSASPAVAQVRVETQGRGFAFVTDDPDRPRLGITTRSSGIRDTLGLLVEAVTPGGPAEKAGIEEGDRLVAINGVNLRLSPDDAADPDMAGVPSRRLIRELAKHKPGDEVELRVYRDGQIRTVKVRPVAADELAERPAALRALRGTLAERAALGLSLGGAGSRRDTLGILVVGVVDGGPAAKAGIEEGDRIAAINGVDLRVAREDAGDREATSARIRRLHRELEKVKPGDAVELRVYANGQTRTLRVEAVRASDLPAGGGAFLFGDIAGPVIRSLRVAPRIDPGLGREMRLRIERDPELEMKRRALDTLRRRAIELESRMQELKSDVERATVRAKQPAAAGDG